MKGTHGETLQQLKWRRKALWRCGSNECWRLICELGVNNEEYEGSLQWKWWTRWSRILGRG